MSPEKTWHNLKIESNPKKKLGSFDVQNKDNEDFENQITKDQEYFKKQLKIWYITEEDFDHLKTKIQERIKIKNSRKFKELEEVDKKYTELKQNILLKSGLELSKEKLVINAQSLIYDAFDINKFTYKNPMWKKFSKWIIDGMIIGNIELAMLVIKNPSKIVEMFSHLFSIEWAKKILEWLWQTVIDLFTGDSYEKWKVAGEAIGLVGWSWIAWWWLKTLGKTIAKKSLTVGSRLWAATLNVAWWSVELTWIAVQIPYNVSKIATEYSVKIAKKWLKGWLNAIKESRKAAKIAQKTATTFVEEDLVATGLKATTKAIKKEVKKEAVEKAIKEVAKEEVKKEVIEKFNSTELKQVVEKLDNWIPLEKHEINKLIANIESNHPMYSILTKMKSWDSFQSIIFTNIKQINTEMWQAFVDDVLNNFKIKVTRSYPWIDIVWNDYKNFVFKKPDWLNIDKKELSKMLHNSYKEVCWGYELKFNEKLIPWLFTQSWKVKWKTQKDIIYSIAEVRSNLEKENLGWNILNIKETRKFEKKTIKKFELWWEFEEVIVKDWKTYKIKDWILEISYSDWKHNYKDTFLINNWDEINLAIITKVRKWEIPESSQLYKDAKLLIDSSIVNWEFILPFVSFEGKLKTGELVSKKQLNWYNELLNDFRNWEKKTNKQIKLLSENSWKLCLTKEVFCEKITDPWLIYFIDIRDLGSHNIIDTLRKIRKTRTKKDAKNLFLESNKGITDEFLDIAENLRSSLKKKYPDYELELFLGWDEIGFYLKWAPPKLLAKVNKDIFEVLGKSDLLKWRVTWKSINKKDILEWWKKIVDGLDKTTQISKTIEKRLNASNESLIMLMCKWYNVKNKKQLLDKILDFSIIEKEGETYVFFKNWLGNEKDSKKIFKLEDIVIDTDQGHELKIDNNPLFNHLDEIWLWRRKLRE